jgi:hypothetical protein
MSEKPISSAMMRTILGFCSIFIFANGLHTKAIKKQVKTAIKA